MSTLEPPTSRRGHLRDFRLAEGQAPSWYRQSLLKNALAALAPVYFVALAAYVGFAAWLETGAASVVVASLALLAMFALVIRALPGHGHLRFGPANIITAIRAAMVSFFGSAVLFGAGASDPVALVAIVAIALAMDGVDGYFARRTGLISPLGTRFDMEVDAFLILLLSLAALLIGKAGWWVLLIGLMRYGFVLGQAFLPFLNAPLPPSFRRKLICVVQVAALCVILLPIVAPPASTVVAAIALGLIVYSFGVDVIDLARRRHLSP
ncbi:MAG: CDP-alcohol phosphatidyltransferase [Rhizobiaceae bacterium]|nr:CDP-alcohol phosphatidyltransferase [Rhizobiaceae bacterium]|tara:strand:- start:145 stop:942 length:798 start_codon:yes stop_codon:yes gene_type:complete